MARYIDADDLEYEVLHEDIDVAKHKCKEYESYVNGANQFRLQVLNIARNFATADVAEVVRCKDCKHAMFYRCKNDPCYNSINCEYQIGIGDEDFFCSCGERRTDNDV